MFERFTDRARRALAAAQREAAGLGHNFVGTEHLLLALAIDGEGIAARALASLGVDIEMIRHDITAIIGEGRRLPSTDADALRTIGIDLDEVLTAATAAFGADRVSRAMTDPASGARRGGPAFTRRMKKVVELSLREALTLRHNYIGTEHLLLAIVREGDGVAARILAGRAGDLDAVRQAVVAKLASAGG